MFIYIYIYIYIFIYIYIYRKEDIDRHIRDMRSNHYLIGTNPLTYTTTNQGHFEGTSGSLHSTKSMTNLFQRTNFTLGDHNKKAELFKSQNADTFTGHKPTQLPTAKGKCLELRSI